MKNLFYFLITLLLSHKAGAQIPDPCTGAGASQPISTASPINCIEAWSGIAASNTLFRSQSTADNAIHTFLTTQSNYAQPTTPSGWQNVTASNMMLDGTVRHEFAISFTTGPATTSIAVINIHQVQINCNAICQDYKIMNAFSGACGVNEIVPTLVTSSLDPTIKYRQYAVLPNTKYIISRQIYYDGGDLDCYLSWTGGDGIGSSGAKITAQHWFIWSNNSIILPITNVVVTARQTGSLAIIQWRTSGEKNTLKYELEKSSDSNKFNKIGEVPAAINTNGTNTYTLEDTKPFTLNFYRVKAIDKNGSTSFSSVVKLTAGATLKNAISISPNPVKDKINIAFISESTGRGFYKIINNMGQIMQSGTLQLTTGSNAIAYNASPLSTGVYVYLASLNNKIYSIKFIKD